MDAERFDTLIRMLTAGPTRRGVLRFLTAGVLASGAALPIRPGSTKKRRGRKGKGKGNKGNKGSKKERCKRGCSGGTLCCDGTCVNVVTDPFNCGVCGNDCRADEACVNTKCQACPPPQVRCTSPTQRSYCADLSSDPQNCGACGKACRENEVCKTGSGGGGVACVCEKTVCPRPDGTSRCCPEVNGVCCADGTCCPAGYICTGTGCCPAGTYSCGDRTCCPIGTTCSGGQCLS